MASHLIPIAWGFQLSKCNCLSIHYNGTKVLHVVVIVHTTPFAMLCITWYFVQS